MSEALDQVREDLRALARVYGTGVGDHKAMCLAVIDRAAACATNLHGEIPADVLGHLVRAMHAAGREDVAGVIEEVEGALALLNNPRSKPRKSTRPPKPSPLSGREGRPRARPAPLPSRAREGKVQTVGETIDPLLTRLKTKNPKE